MFKKKKKKKYPNKYPSAQDTSVAVKIPFGNIM